MAMKRKTFLKNKRSKFFGHSQSRLARLKRSKQRKAMILTRRELHFMQQQEI